MCDLDGELFIKPCTQAEINFYESANAMHLSFADLMPTFMGTLQLSDPADMASLEGQSTPSIVANGTDGPAMGSAPAVVDGVTWVPNNNRRIKTNQAVVLENSASGFKRPNIMDVKLGTRLWADDAPLEKKRRFDKIAAETTHADLGFRIAGMRVYRGSHAHAHEAELDENMYRVYDKDYGRFSVKSHNVHEAFRRFLFADAAGIDDDLARAVAAAFLVDLRRVRMVLEQEESRMYSSSLLFVFEGDGDALRAAIEQTNAIAEAIAAKKGSSDSWDSPAGRSTHRVDSGIGLSDNEEGPCLPKIYTLKLIDFAHAQWTPGQGPDENVLKGVRSLIEIFERLCE